MLIEARPSNSRDPGCDASVIFHRVNESLDPAVSHVLDATEEYAGKERPHLPMGNAFSVPRILGSFLSGPDRLDGPHSGMAACGGNRLRRPGDLARIDRRTPSRKAVANEAALNADHELVTSGPYRIIRHPIYASMFAMMIMSVLLLGKLPWWPIAIALFLTGIEIRIHAEDRLLRERFGSRFEDWKSKVPAYVPLLR
jgi:hypothetical protein